MIKFEILIIFYNRWGGNIKMAKCEICGKGLQFGKQISHSHRVTNITWSPNIQKAKVKINNSIKRINICTKCLKAGKVEKVS